MQIALDCKRLDLSFLFCLSLTLATPTLFPSIRLSFFVPFLIISMYKNTLPTTLWLGFLCGFILDLLSSYPRLGMHAFNFCLVLFLLFPQKRYFFADSLTTLPIMTFFFASFSSLLMLMMTYGFEINHVLSWQWAATDLIIMPAIDAVFAFCCFILPGLLFGKPRKRGKDYFLQ
jgi:rod shape-determining protein MreD